MPHPTTTCDVRHPVTGAFEALDPAVNYPDDHELVLAYAWAFAPVKSVTGIVESVTVEKATAEPGEKRTRKSPRR